MERVAIATACFAPVGGFWGVTWSLPKTARVAEKLGAKGLGVCPLRGAVGYQEDGSDLAVPILYMTGRFSGPIGWVMSPSEKTCEQFVEATARRLSVPIEVHDPDEAANLVKRGFEAWMEIIPEKGLSLEKHLQKAEEGGFGIAVDFCDEIGRHGLHEPFGDPREATITFLESGLVRNIHAQTTGAEVALILKGRGDETIIASLLRAVAEWGYEGLLTLEVNPLTIWPVDPPAIFWPGRYLMRLGQLLDWVREQVS